eukprot:jgi/Chrzof1/13984/Cz08g20050.t1
MKALHTAVVLAVFLIGVVSAHRESSHGRALLDIKKGDMFCHVGWRGWHCHNTTLFPWDPSSMVAKSKWPAMPANTSCIICAIPGADILDSAASKTTVQAPAPKYNLTDTLNKVGLPSLSSLPDGEYSVPQLPNMAKAIASAIKADFMGYMVNKDVFVTDVVFNLVCLSWDGCAPWDLLKAGQCGKWCKGIAAKKKLTPAMLPKVAPTLFNTTAAKPKTSPAPAASSIKLTTKPTMKPTSKATAKPTMKPTTKATAKPTMKPTAKVTAKPTMKPTAKVTAKPTMERAQASVKATMG